MKPDNKVIQLLATACLAWDDREDFDLGYIDMDQYVICIYGHSTAPAAVAQLRADIDKITTRYTLIIAVPGDEVSNIYIRDIGL